MDLRPDGTIVVQFPRRRPVTSEDGTITGWEATVDTETVSMRLPILDELLDLWTAIDTLSDTPVEGVAPLDEDAKPPSVIANAVVNLRRNAVWIRTAIHTLGTPDVYEGDGSDLRIRQDLAEPAWFSSATAAGQMLRHWQEVPLGHGPQLAQV